jgi:hypothetical protein
MSKRLHQIPAAIATTVSYAWPSLLIAVVILAVT